MIRFISAVMATFCLTGTAVANATPMTVNDYIDANHGWVCKSIDRDPSVAGLLSVNQAILNDTAFTDGQIATVVTQSVVQYCPRNYKLLVMFNDAWTVFYPVNPDWQGMS